jgi:hypothetical protein
MVNQLFRSLVHCFGYAKGMILLKLKQVIRAVVALTVSFENFGNSLQLQNKVLMVLQSLK